MRRFLLISILTLISSLCFAQNTIEFFDFVENFNWEISESDFLQKYDNRIINENDSITDLHAVTGCWYLKDFTIHDFQAAEALITFSPESKNIAISSTLKVVLNEEVTSEISTGQILPEFDNEEFYAFIERRWGKPGFVEEQVPLKDFLPNYAEYGTGDLSMWTLDGCIAMMISIPSDDYHFYTFLYTRNSEACNQLKEEDANLDVKDITENSTKFSSDIDPIFYNYLCLGQQLSEKKLLNAFLLASGEERDEDIVNNIVKNIEPNGIAEFIFGHTVHYLGLDWDFMGVNYSNGILMGVSYFLTNGDLTQRYLQTKSLLSNIYGAPIRVDSDGTSWYDKNNRFILLTNHDNTVYLNFRDTSTENSNATTTFKNLQTHFLGNLDLGEQLTLEDIKSSIRRSAKIFVNEVTALSPEDFILKEKASLNSTLYTITTPVYFAGEEWDYVTLQVVGNSLASVEFNKSVPMYEESSIDRSLNNWKDAFVGKYGIYKYMYDSNNKSDFYLWTDFEHKRITASLNKVLSKSKGGEMRYYFKISYSDGELVDQLYGAIQDEF